MRSLTHSCCPFVCVSLLFRLRLTSYVLLNTEYWGFVGFVGFGLVGFGLGWVFTTTRRLLRLTSYFSSEVR